MDPERVSWQWTADAGHDTEPSASRGQADGVSRTDQPRRPPAGPGQSPANRGRAASRPSVLVDRLAASLVHHEPGWRLPRHSALARRYDVSPADIDKAIDELIARHMVRRLADGQLYRASPAEYLISLEGVAGLVSYVDAMGGQLSCRSRQVSWRLPPEDIGWALKLSPIRQVCTVRSLWTAGGEPAALCTTYLPAVVAGQEEASVSTGLPDVLSLLRLGDIAEGTAADAPDRPARPAVGEPTALHIELQPPPPAVARSLRLSASQPAVIVTTRFDETETAKPVALTMAVLRPDMFRVVVQSPNPPLPDAAETNLASSWTHMMEDWEP